jgi:hypothetical protein
MMISKRFLIAAALILGLQLNIGAYYDATALKTEITSVFNFMDTLRQENSEPAQTLVAQLEKELKNAEEKYDWSRYTLENIDIIDMARIIEKNTTIDAKIIEISAILTLKETAKQIHMKKESDRQYWSTMACIAAFAGFSGTLFAITAVQNYLALENMKKLKNLIPIVRVSGVVTLEGAVPTQS